MLVYFQGSKYSSLPLSAGIRVPSPSWILESVDNTEPYTLWVFKYLHIPKIQFSLKIINIKTLTKVANNKIEYCLVQ
jgi:hypothetical protein